MHVVFLAGGYIVAGFTWLLTTYYAFVNWGLLGALAAFFIPPLDLVFMFMLGTWQWGVIALILLGIGGVIASTKR